MKKSRQNLARRRSGHSLPRVMTDLSLPSPESICRSVCTASSMCPCSRALHICQQCCGSMASVEARKRAPPEKAEAISLRTKIVFSFWAIILCLGVPVWHQTTSIYRATLPLQEMLAWADSAVSKWKSYNVVCDANWS